MLDLRKSQTQIFSRRLVQIKHSQLIIKDLERLNDVNKLELKSSYLLNSYIMNLVASWQTFIEQLVTQSVGEISKSSNDTVKAILFANSDDKLKKFNTPNTANIDSIFESVIGIKKITSSLNNADQTIQKINSIMLIRHKIAHKGFSQHLLTIEKNFEYMQILLSAAGQLENNVKNFIENNCEAK